MINLKNKNVIITGASGGIGKELVFSFAELGANITLLSRNIIKMDAILISLKKKYSSKQSFKVLKLDITKEEDVIKTFKTIVDTNKTIDVLINNAGITNDNIIARMSSEQWHSVINTNLNGCFYCCKSASKQMIKQKYGKIINICSIIAEIGNKGQANYAASKAGVIGLTKSLAKELASRNINANVINPGYIDTEMTNRLSNTVKESFLKDIPLKRFGNVKDVSNIACFLASKEADYITGQVINVDGGIVM